MASQQKERIDVLLVNKGFARSRERAKDLLKAGLVFVDNQPINKAGVKVSIDADIIVSGSDIPYVSRGGLKLEKALNVFDVPVEGKTFLDVGASTGGFTDCLLKNGAKTVIAIDVGYDQFAENLREDPRVILMERTNIRNVKREDITLDVNGAVIDVSFISLKLVLPVVIELLSDDSHVVALIKPQFEAGKGRVGKNGVVKDPLIHREVLMNVSTFAKETGYKVVNLDHSPIKGPEGNIEFLCHLYKGSSVEYNSIEEKKKVENVVSEAHLHLQGG